MNFISLTYVGMISTTCNLRKPTLTEGKQKEQKS